MMATSGETTVFVAALIAAASRLVSAPGPSTSAAPEMATARTASSILLRRPRRVGRTRGTSACRVPWPGRVVVGLALLGVALLLVTLEPTRARAAQSGSQPGPTRAIPAADAAPVHAYHQPAPDSARFHNVS
jgi:hypothetical protein